MKPWALIILAACEPPLMGTFEGELPSNADVQFMVEVGELRMSLYVAGVDDTLDWSRFFESPLTEDRQFTAATDGWQAVGGEVPGGAYAFDLVDPEGKIHELTAQPLVDPNSPDGVYEGALGTCRVGGIVYNTAGQVKGAACAADGSLVPLEVPDGGLAPTDNGQVSVEADPDGNGPQPITLSRVVP